MSLDIETLKAVKAKANELSKHNWCGFKGHSAFAALMCWLSEQIKENAPEPEVKAGRAAKYFCEKCIGPGKRKFKPEFIKRVRKAARNVKAGKTRKYTPAQFRKKFMRTDE